MAVTYSQMMELGTRAPAFELPVANPEVDDRAGVMRSLEDYADAEALLVVFTCNHCPYAVHVEDELIRVARSYQDRGVAVIAISANDAQQYPEDSFEAMQERAREKDYPFPYAYDASQEVAAAYGAVCTPDFFLFDADRRLVYRGRMDDTRPSRGEPHAQDLRAALDQLLEEGTVTVEQFPSMGCNIKWKPGR